MIGRRVFVLFCFAFCLSLFLFPSSSLEPYTYDYLASLEAPYSVDYYLGYDTLPSYNFEVVPIADALYEAIIRANNEQIDDLTPVDDLSIMPLWTGDTGQTPIPGGNLRTVLTSLIGPYSPVVVQYSYNNGSSTQYLREIMPDYVWMISAAIFALVLYSVFRLWGAVFCRK